MENHEFLSKHRRPSEQLATYLIDSVTWINNGRQGFDDRTGNFKKVDSVLPRMEWEGEKIKDFEGAIDWMEYHDFLSKPRRSSEQPATHLFDSITWINNGRQGFDDCTGNFKKFDSVFPRMEWEGEKLKDIEGARPRCRMVGSGNGLGVGGRSVIGMGEGIGGCVGQGVDCGRYWFCGW
jgi:hypothetical protein